MASTTTTRRPTRVSVTPRPSSVRSSLLPVPGSGDCGLQAIDKIFGGNKTAINEYPWLALLEFTWSKSLFFILRAKRILVTRKCFIICSKWWQRFRLRWFPNQ